MLQGTVEPSEIDAIVEEGRALIQGGNAKDAVECFVKAAEQDPTNAKVWNDLGVALFITDQIQPAIEAFATAIRYDAKFPDAYINLATAASKTGNQELTHGTLNDAMQALPDNQEIRAVCRDLGGYKTSAAATAAPTTEGRPAIDDPVQANVMKGRELVAQGQPAEAAQAFLRALELEPKCAPAWNDLGVAMFTDGQPDAAYEAFQTCLTHDPSFADAAMNMVAAAKKVGKTADAIVALQGVLAVDPANSEARTALSQLEKESSSDEADRQTKALELMHVGRQSLADKDYAVAGRKFLEATEAAPGFAPPWNDLGVALYLEEHNDLAFQAFETALQLAPGFVDAAINLAKCSKRIGRFEDAKSSLEIALAKNPGDKDLREAIHPSETNDRPTSVPIQAVTSQMAVSISEQVNPLEECLLQGRALLSAGRTKEACESFLTAIEMDLTCGTSWNDLGVALFQGGQVESSVEAFETAMMHEPTMIDSPINLAMALRRLGQVDAAINVLQTAMIRCPEEKDLQATYEAFMKPAQPSQQTAAVTSSLGVPVSGRSFVAIDVDVARANAKATAAREEGATHTEVHVPTAIRDGLVGAKAIGESGVVYCGQVIERVPNPVQTLNTLRQVATDTVVVTTRCVPDIVEASVGSIQFTGNSACFIPAAGEAAKSILEAYEAEQGREVEFINGTAVEGGWLLGTQDEPNAVWWAWTDDFVQKMIETAGFLVVQKTNTAEEGVKAFVCRVV